MAQGQVQVPQDHLTAVHVPQTVKTMYILTGKEMSTGKRAIHGRKEPMDPGRKAICLNDRPPGPQLLSGPAVQLQPLLQGARLPPVPVLARAGTAVQVPAVQVAAVQVPAVQVAAVQAAL